ncbi:hypothetical protein OK016_27300 [Vibrio chagasii]|nr:hypothetical protein [Vibrio chagasii]
MDTQLKSRVGLRHHADADMLLKRIARGQDIQDLRILSSTPGQHNTMLMAGKKWRLY